MDASLPTGSKDPGIFRKLTTIWSGYVNVNRQTNGQTTIA